MQMNTEQLAKKVRLDVLEMIHNSHASHIASAYSVCDVLCVLYNEIMKWDAKNPLDPNRDRLVLSKGHAGSALYALLSELGFFDKNELKTYYQNGSKLSGHISHKGVPGIELSTGSLGHGVCVASGMALALKRNSSASHVYAIIGDGEMNEGSFWETALFAEQYKLNNLTVIVDYNKMQAMGNTADVLNTGDISEKMKLFGWNVITVDGHNYKELSSSFLTKFNNDKPTFIVANTVKGKGVSFMENCLKWHYSDPQGDYYLQAKKELEGNVDEK